LCKLIDEKAHRKDLAFVWDETPKKQPKITVKVLKTLCEWLDFKPKRGKTKADLMAEVIEQLEIVYANEV